MELIGKKLEDVINYLEKENIKYIVVDNNYNVNGDTKLVTNAVANDNGYVITTGDFIFNIRNDNAWIKTIYQIILQLLWTEMVDGH